MQIITTGRKMISFSNIYCIMSNQNQLSQDIKLPKAGRTDASGALQVCSLKSNIYSYANVAWVPTDFKPRNYEDIDNGKVCLLRISSQKKHIFLPFMRTGTVPTGSIGLNKKIRDYLNVGPSENVSYTVTVLRVSDFDQEETVHFEARIMADSPNHVDIKVIKKEILGYLDRSLTYSIFTPGHPLIMKHDDVRVTLVCKNEEAVLFKRSTTKVNITMLLTLAENV